MNESKIFIGRVIDVDVNNYTVDVELNNGSNIGKIQLSTNFFNSKEGSGIVGHPELDSICLVSQLDNGEYVVLGFIASLDQFRNSDDEPVDGEVGFRNFRPKWMVGDFGFSGPGANFIKLESSGIVHLKSSYLSQLYLIPDPINMVKFICDNLSLDIGYNQIKIENNRTTNETNFKFKIKSSPNNQSSSDDEVEIKIGKEGNIFTVTVGGVTVLNISPRRTVTVNNNLLVRP